MITIKKFKGCEQLLEVNVWRYTEILSLILNGNLKGKLPVGGGEIIKIKHLLSFSPSRVVT